MILYFVLICQNPVSRNLAIFNIVYYVYNLYKPQNPVCSYKTTGGGDSKTSRSFFLKMTKHDMGFWKYGSEFCSLL